MRLIVSKHGICIIIIISHNYLNIYRGDDFRVSFSKIGELRSLIPDEVSVMALTATATSDTLKVVTDRLSLKNPVVIGSTPDQVNLKFFVEPLATNCSNTM